ncbi:MAG: hypothetical protein IPL99_14565 [Candidatus Competibacteraceae bacterium]|nr:hypothetical protein [Candidatus Competibacteraceae bacterium]
MIETITRKVVANEEELNRDPLTGAPGALPTGYGRWRGIRRRPELPSEWRRTDWRRD